jgi:hypothetical protein
MKSFLFVLSIVAWTFGLTACASETSQEATATAAELAQPAASPESSPAPAAKAAGATSAAKPNVIEKPNAATARMYEIPQGTPITVFLTDPISTAKNKAGDTFTASLADPIVINGETVVARGATVKGRVIDAEGSGRVKGTANIRLALTSIVADGKSYPVATRPFVADAEATKGRDAGVIAGASGVGAAIGAITGGKKGAATGAVIGGAAGTGAVLATKGKEVEFDSETKLTFALEKAAELPRIRQ